MWWLGCLAALLAPAVQAQPSNSPEYNLKAGLLTLFPRYTEWPANARAGSNAPILIGVLGEDPFGQVLRETAEEQAGPPLRVRHLTSLEEAAQCQVVFISRAESGHEAAWLAALKGKPIVTVGESGHTLERGGMIELKLVAGHVRFDVSWPAMQQATVKFSAAMLQSARRVFKTRDNLN